MKNILVVVPTYEMLGAFFREVPICMTGFGSINTALYLTRAIQQSIHKPDLILHFGWAASEEVQRDTIVFTRKAKPLDEHDAPHPPEDALFQDSAELLRENYPADAFTWAKVVRVEDAFTEAPIKRTEPQQAPICFDSGEALAVARTCLAHQIPILSFQLIGPIVTTLTKDGQTTGASLNTKAYEFYRIYENIASDEEVMG